MISTPHKVMRISNSTLDCSSFDLHQGPLSKQPILHSAINMMRGGNFRLSPVLRKRCRRRRQRARRLGRGCRLQPRISSRAGDVQFVFDNARSASQSGSRSSDPSHRNWWLQSGFPYRFVPVRPAPAAAPAPCAGQRSLLPCRPVATKSLSSPENISNGP